MPPRAGKQNLCVETNGMGKVSLHVVHWANSGSQTYTGLCPEGGNRLPMSPFLKEKSDEKNMIIYAKTIDLY